MADVQDSDTTLHKPDVSIFTSTDVYESSGSNVQLASFFKPDSTLAIVLIRHWGCVACQTYIRKLTTEASLDQLNVQNARIIIIGHGDPKLISSYKDRTGSAFDIYSDPDRSLYEKLGMGQMGSLWHEANVEAPSYHERGFLGDFTAAIKTIPSWGTGFARVGNKAQLGGEYVFRTDGNGNSTCTYGRRMPNSRNHTMPADLLAEITRAASP